jgi:hypothetical protein
MRLKKVTAEQSKTGILEVKTHCFYSFVQRNRFPGQDFRGTSFVFKMSTHGLGSGVELVRRMTEGDLYHAYTMFNHIKRIHKWTMLGAHVYDPFCQRLLTIAVCDMKTETEDSQQRF